MKKEINLLAPEAREKRTILLKQHKMEGVLSVCVATCMVILVAYGVIWQSNRIVVDSLDTRLLEQGKVRAVIEQDIAKINTIIHAMDKRVTTNRRWAVRIPEILEKVPTGIKVMKLELQEKQSSLVITGKAINGDVVVQYQHALSELPWVDHVDAPLQNFARSPDAVVTFTIIRKTDNNGLL